MSEGKRGITRFFRIAACLVWLPAIFPFAGAANPAEEPKTGTVSGVVVNVSNGAFLNGTTIQIVSLGLEVETDLDGIYSIELTTGSYQFKVHHKGFVDQVVDDVRVVAGKVTYQDIALNPEGMALGEVTVVAESSRVSAEALLAERKANAAVSDSIGAQEMSRLTGSAAADVMSRITGVSVVDDRYVYIRGLGERYNNTILNGAVIPSPRPHKKAIPMDLFPASLLENIQTEKSYTPDKPGDFSGGVINLRTVDFPRRGGIRTCLNVTESCWIVAATKCESAEI